METKSKTYKREVAFIILLWLIYLSVWGLPAVLEIVVWPAFLYILGAYGLDETSKNILPSLNARLGGKL